MNCKPSTLKDHENTEIHKRAVQEKEIEDESKSGLHIKQKVIEQHIPKNPPFSERFSKFSSRGRYPGQITGYCLLYCIKKQFIYGI